MLEPCAVKVASTVLRGGDDSNAIPLPGDSDDPELIACTDGVHIEAGSGYEKYDDAERRFIVLHELLHVALAHPARWREMERRTEDFDARVNAKPVLR